MISVENEVGLEPFAVQVFRQILKHGDDRRRVGVATKANTFRRLALIL